MYTVDGYLELLAAADLQSSTLKTYREHFSSFARFLAVPLADLHNHLTPENLVRYAAGHNHPHSPHLFVGM